MKIWVKYLVGCAVGFLAAMLLPSFDGNISKIMNFAYDIAVRLGCYSLLPILFFSVSISFFKLRSERILIKSVIWIFCVLISSTLLLTILGISTSLLSDLSRIPITTEKSTEIPTFSLATLINRIFPFSSFSTLTEGAYLIPCFVFAALAGYAAASDKSASKIAFSVFDSMCSVFYKVMSFFLEILSVAMIAIMFKWTTEFFVVAKSGTYNSLFFLLLVDFLLVALVIYPILIRIFCNEYHPYRVLYAGFCPLIVAFFSGDENLALSTSLRHCSESLGIKRKSGAVSLPLFFAFGRSGTALVVATSFILILRSYSSLGLSFFTTLWIGIFSFLISFALAEIPTGGAFAAIATLCALYGKGFESGYLLLKGAAPVICAFATALDTLCAISGSYIVACRTKMASRYELSEFI